MVTAPPGVIVLGVHIAAGFIALFAGAIALVTEKGGDRHRQTGRPYVRSMAVVVGTVPILLAFDPTDFARQFLLLVAVFSGYRVLSRKRPAADGQPLDWVAAGLLAISSLGLGGWGLALVLGGTQTQFSDIGIVLAVFGGIGIVAGMSDLRDFRNVDRRDPWMADHLGRMIGGYIATVTAISVVNLSGILPGAVAWLWPTAIGVPLIWYWKSKYSDIGPLASVIE